MFEQRGGLSLYQTVAVAWEKKRSDDIILF